MQIRCKARHAPKHTSNLFKNGKDESILKTTVKDGESLDRRFLLKNEERIKGRQEEHAGVFDRKIKQYFGNYLSIIRKIIQVHSLFALFHILILSGNVPRDAQGH